MCGIAGVVSFYNSNDHISLNILKNMSDIITHRGPDSEGQWISSEHNCGLTFRRLAIIDLSESANQPMHSNEGRYSIVFNGEIYNHLAIRKELEAKQCKYKSKSDTETILNGYIDSGPGILNKMLGMWGLAIWDNEKKELFAARDRIGIKPFYYYYKNGLFIFASEIKAILQHPAISKELNLNELTNYLNYGTSISTSLFKDIRKLAPGHFLILNKSGLEIHKYWSPIDKIDSYTDLTPSEIQTELINKLRISIKDRMMSDVPFGVFLSGGIDSSLNVALMSELMNRPVDTFTVGFKELEKYNELEYARQIAKIYNTNHKEILIDHNDALPILNELVWHEDEPNADPVCVPLYFLSKLTRDSGTIVVQVGEGSDEQFCGYPWMLRDYLFEKSYFKLFSTLPKFIKRSFYASIKPILESANQYMILDYIRRGVEKNELYWGGASIFPPSEQRNLISDNYHNLLEIPAKTASNFHKIILEKKQDADYLQRILFTELSWRLPELLLMRVDKIGMAHSIEARVPFLDSRIVEFSMSIPDRIKAPNRKSTKILLKKAVEGILPDNIIHRKKQGFWAPVNEWLRTHWFNYAKSVILNSDLIKFNIFNTDYIEKLFKDHKSSKANNGYKLFTLLTLSLWYKRYFT